MAGFVQGLAILHQQTSGDAFDVGEPFAVLCVLADIQAILFGMDLFDGMEKIANALTFIGIANRKNQSRIMQNRAQFHQCSTYSFYACRSQKRKKTLMT